MKRGMKKRLKGMLAMFLSVVMTVTYIPETSLTALAVAGGVQQHSGR